MFFLPGGLVDVGADAFGNCQILSDITIYGLELTDSEYHTLKTAGNRSSEGIYVLREMPKHELVHKIVSAVINVNPACKIPDSISSLFQLVEFDEQKGKFSLEKNIPVIGFTIPSIPVSENKAFCEHI